MILNLYEYKKLQNIDIDNNDNDNLIEFLIEIVQNQIIEITKNKFLNENLEYKSSFTFEKNNKIIDNNSSFLEKGFSINNDIYIENSIQNDGFYFINSITASEIITRLENIKDENSNQNLVKITKVEFPKGIKFIASQMIKYNIENKSYNNIKSENVGDYSVTFKDDKNNMAYPEPIISGLRAYYKVNFL